VGGEKIKRGGRGHMDCSVGEGSWGVGRVPIGKVGKTKVRYAWELLQHIT